MIIVPENVAVERKKTTIIENWLTPFRSLLLNLFKRST
jgi:hypothetical protein